MKATTEMKQTTARVEYWQGETQRLHREWQAENFEDGFTFGGRFALVWTAERTIPDGGTPAKLAEHIWHTHNVDDRPRGREIRSMSVGDVLVIQFAGGDTIILRAANFGFQQVDPRDWLRAPKQSEAEMESRMKALHEACRDGRLAEVERALTESRRTPTLPQLRQEREQAQA